MITEGDLKSRRAISATARLWRWPSLKMMTIVLLSSAAGSAVASVAERATRMIADTPMDVVRVRIVPPWAGICNVGLRNHTRSGGKLFHRPSTLCQPSLWGKVHRKKDLFAAPEALRHPKHAAKACSVL